MALNEIIARNHNDIAFIVGNGINRYPNNPRAVSWDHLLLELWEKFAPNALMGDRVPKGLTLTEFYDILELSNFEPGVSRGGEIQKEAVKIMNDWEFHHHHSRFMEKAREIDAPVLTTNFDMILPTALRLNQFYINSNSFSDFYPWNTYFGERQLINPTDGFGVWYLNGFVKYFRSIRLGLTHYMGCVDRARTMLHTGENNPFNGKNREDWKGRPTWLHILFNKSICVFGLSLEENEVFIRWLLIERAKYFKKFEDRRKAGWYIATRSTLPNESIEGKKLFMRSVGLEYIEVDNFEDIYVRPWE